MGDALAAPSLRAAIARDRTRMAAMAGNNPPTIPSTRVKPSAMAIDEESTVKAKATALGSGPN